MNSARSIVGFMQFFLLDSLIFAGNGVSKTLPIEPQLAEAIKSNDKELMVSLLECDLDFTWRDERGLSILHKAISTGHAGCCKILMNCIKQKNLDVARKLFLSRAPCATIIAANIPRNRAFAVYGDLYDTCAVLDYQRGMVHNLKNEQRVLFKKLSDDMSIRYLSLSKDRSRILVLKEDGKASILNNEGTLIADLEHGGYIKVAYQGKPTGKYKLVGTGMLKDPVEVYETVYKDEWKVFAITNATQSPSSWKKSYIATLAESNTIKLWDWAGQEIASLTHPDKVVKIMWSERDDYLLAATADLKHIFIWNVSTKRYDGIQKEKPIRTWGYNAQSGFLYIIDKEAIKIYDSTGTRLRERHGNCQSAAWNSDGTVLFFSCDSAPYLWNMQSDEKFYLESSTIKQGKWHASGRHIGILADQELTVWNTEGKCAAIRQHDGLYDSFEWHPESSVLLVHKKSGDYSVWEFESDKWFDCKKMAVGARIWHNHTRFAWFQDGAVTNIWDLESIVETPLDWACREVFSGADIGILRCILEAFPQEESIAGLCSSESIKDLCYLANKTKILQPNNYKAVCEVIAMLVSRPGAPL